MYCIKCGTQLPDDARFCTECGAKISPDLSKKQRQILGDKFEAKRDAVRKEMGFQRSSYTLLQLCQVQNIILSVARFFPLLLVVWSLLFLDVIGVVFDIIIFIAFMFVADIVKISYQELEREYEFHGRKVVAANRNILDIFSDAEVEGFKRYRLAFAHKIDRVKPVKKMSEQEWLDYYIELRANLACVDKDEYIRAIIRQNQMQQQQMQMQQQMQQQQMQMQQQMEQQMQQMNNMILH